MALLAKAAKRSLYDVGVLSCDSPTWSFHVIVQTEKNLIRVKRALDSSNGQDSLRYEAKRAKTTANKAREARESYMRQEKVGIGLKLVHCSNERSGRR